MIVALLLLILFVLLGGGRVLVVGWGGAYCEAIADVATILLLSFCGHIVVSHVGRWLGVKDTRW